MKLSWVLVIGVIVLLAAAVVLAVAVSYHRVVVLDGIDGSPLSGAWISLVRASGSEDQVGRTGENGELAFWNNPFPLPRRICAQYLFYAPDCVSALGLARLVIELAVP